MKTNRLSERVSGLIEYVEQLEAAIEDLHGNIQVNEWHDLDEDTRYICRYVHTLRSHPEIDP